MPLDRRAFASLLMGPALASAASLRMAYFDRYPPLSHRERDGPVRGLLVDLVERVSTDAGLTVSHHAYPWARAQAMVRSGELDGLCSTVTPTRSAYLLFCNTPLLVLRFAVCHRIDDRRIAALRNLPELLRLRHGNYRGNGYSETHLQSDSLQVDHDPDSVLRRISLGDLDIYIDAELNARHRLKALGLGDRLQVTLVDFLPPAAYALGLRRSLAGVEGLVARLETAVRAARDSGWLERTAAGYR